MIMRTNRVSVQFLSGIDYQLIMNMFVESGSSFKVLVAVFANRLAFNIDVIEENGAANDSLTKEKFNQ